MCNEVTEYAGMLFKIIACYLGDIHVKQFRSVFVSWFGVYFWTVDFSLIEQHWNSLPEVLRNCESEVNFK